MKHYDGVDTKINKTFCFSKSATVIVNIFIYLRRAFLWLSLRKTRRYWYSSITKKVVYFYSKGWTESNNARIVILKMLQICQYLWKENSISSLYKPHVFSLTIFIDLNGFVYCSQWNDRFKKSAKKFNIFFADLGQILT